jgi:hypothetical protein
MDTSTGSDGAPANRTTVERRSPRELVVTRTFDAPARIVFDAWTKPELLNRWWAPRSRGVTLFKCEADIRTGGSYRYEYGRDPAQAMVFSGTYTEVTPPSPPAWSTVCGRRSSSSSGCWRRSLLNAE